MPSRTIVAETVERRLVILVRVADRVDRWTTGFRCATPGEIRTTPLLFDFGQTVLVDFDLEDIATPLDVGFVTDDGSVFAILQMEARGTRYRPTRPFRYALQARSNFFADERIVAGRARLVMDPS